MACNNCNSNACSCGPVRLTTTYLDCPGGEPCDQVLSADCVKYMGDTLADFPLHNGDRISRFMQALLLRELDPTGFAGQDSIHSPYWIESLAITDTTMDIRWDIANNSAYEWILSYSTDNSTWTDVTGIAVNKDTYQLINLTPSTKYYVKVAGSSLGGGVIFYSLTIEVTTKS
jgi:hypothetical protein